MIDKKVELLSPAGDLETIKTAVDAGADAVYFGTKTFNMRQHRPTLNLERSQVKEAIAICHEAGARAYITFNNLLGCHELDDAYRELEFFCLQKPDAFIVQDFATIDMLNQIGGESEIHASTMLNSHNSGMVKFLAGLGVCRVVTSRDISLEDVKKMWEETGIEMEYFVHGDMCVAESGQCYQSSITFGESSNRGRCMKPCRWRYDLVRRNEKGQERIFADNAMLLAKKDMSLFDYLEELVDHNVASLKIEGRARSSEYLNQVVSTYRQELDRVFAKKKDEQKTKAGQEALEKVRIRDLSVCAAFGRPGKESIDPSGEREPRIFSTAKSERQLQIESSRPSQGYITNTPELIVATSGSRQAISALEQGADLACLPVESWKNIDLAKIDRKKLAITTPRVLTDEEMEEWLNYMKKVPGDIIVEINNFGLIEPLRHMGFSKFFGGFALNILNEKSAQLLAVKGLSALTLSFECGDDNMRSLLDCSQVDIYVPVHGFIPGMLMSYCPAKSAIGCPGEKVCLLKFSEWMLRDTSGGNHYLHREMGCRVLVSAASDLCLLPWIADFARAGARGVRLGLEYYSIENIKQTVAIYRKHLNGNQILDEQFAQDIKKLVDCAPRPLGLGAYQNGCFEKSEEGKKLEKILVGAAAHS